MANKSNPSIEVSIGLKAVDMGMEKALNSIFDKIQNAGLAKGPDGYTAVFHFKTDFKNQSDLDAFTKILNELQDSASKNGVAGFLDTLKSKMSELETLGNAPHLTFAEQLEKDLKQANDAIDKFEMNSKASLDALSDALNKPTKSKASAFNKVASSYESQIKDVSSALSKAMDTAVNSGDSGLVDKVQKKIQEFTSSFNIDADKIKKLSDFGFSTSDLENIQKQIDTLKNYKDAITAETKSQGTTEAKVGVGVSAEDIQQAVEKAVDEYNSSIAPNAKKAQIYAEIKGDNVTVDTDDIDKKLKEASIKLPVDIDLSKDKTKDLQSEVNKITENGSETKAKVEEKATKKAAVRVKVKNLPPVKTPVTVTPEVKADEKSIEEATSKVNDIQQQVEKKVQEISEKSDDKTPIESHPKVKLVADKENIDVEGFTEDVKKLITDSLEGTEITTKGLKISLGEDTEISGLTEAVSKAIEQSKKEGTSKEAEAKPEAQASSETAAASKKDIQTLSKASNGLDKALSKSIKDVEHLGNSLDEIIKKYNTASEQAQAMAEAQNKINHSGTAYEDQINGFAQSLTKNASAYSDSSIQNFADTFKKLKEYSIKDTKNLIFDKDASAEMERLRAEVVKLFDDFSKNANASTSDVEHLTKAISSLFLQMQDVNLQANLTRDKFEALQKIVTNLDQLKGLATVGSDKNALSSVYPTVSQDSAEFKQVTTEATALKQMLTSVNTFAKLQDQILQKRKELGTDGNLAPVQKAIEAISNDLVTMNNHLTASVKLLDKANKANVRANENSGITGEDLSNKFSAKLGTAYEKSKEPEKYFYGAENSGIYTNISNASSAMDKFLDTVKSKGDLTKGEVKELTEQFKNLKTAISDAERVADKKVSGGSFIEKIGKNLAGEDLKQAISQLASVKSQLEGASNLSWSTNSFSKAGQDVTKLTANFADQEGQLRTLNLLYNQATGEVSELGNSMKPVMSLGERFKSIFQREAMSFTSYLATGASFYQVINAVKQGIGIVEEVDSAMTDLRKVSNATQEQLDSFRSSAFQTADAVGSTGKDIIEAASDWQKLGYSLQEAQTLAKNSAIYMNVGDISDADTATADLVSTMKAFNLTADDSIDIVNKLNEVGNNYAIDSAGLGEALKRSSAALAQGGNDLNQSIGLIVGANDVLQDPETAGQALKTISLRLRKTKVELTDVGEDADGAAESISDLRKQVIALSGVDIMKDENTYKSTYEILKEISPVYSKLTDKNQAGLLELLAGL